MALFMALGFVLGNIGSNLTSEVTFARMLWPMRYYHTKTPWKLALMRLTISVAGASQVAGKRATNECYYYGLFNGAKDGDMLGTAFFEDSQTGYRAFAKCEGRVEPTVAEDARNNWTAVIASMRQEGLATSGTRVGRVHSRKGDFANRRVFHLTLMIATTSRVPPNASPIQSTKFTLKPSSPSCCLEPSSVR